MSLLISNYYHKSWLDSILTVAEFEEVLEKL